MVKRKELDNNTEAKIKAAARKVFHQKGFAAARTRDIAEEADINLALLNYYFRSKEKLFEIIMFETMQGFIKSMGSVFNDKATSFENKIELIVENYIDLMQKEPEIPMFILSEMRNEKNNFFEKVPFQEMVMRSAFFKQFKEAQQRGELQEMNPLHFLMNLIGLIIFPFAASPIIKKIGSLSEIDFTNLMLERKKMIPLWVKTMVKTK